MRMNVLAMGMLVGVASVLPCEMARAADLGVTMKQMGAAMKALGRDTADLTDNSAALKDVATLEKASLAAKEMTPPMVEKMSGEQKTKALGDFRKEIGKLIKAEIDLEGAIVDKSAADVKTDTAAIMDIMKEGHKEFRKGR